MTQIVVIDDDQAIVGEFVRIFLARLEQGGVFCLL